MDKIIMKVNIKTLNNGFHGNDTFYCDTWSREETLIIFHGIRISNNKYKKSNNTKIYNVDQIHSWESIDMMVPGLWEDE